MLKRPTLVIIAIALTLALTLSACGSDPMASAEVSGIESRGALRVGVRDDLPSFCSKTDAGFEGLEADIARALAKKILGDENAVEFTVVTTRTRGQKLDTNEIDFAIAIYATSQQRQSSYNFSTPYYTDVYALLVKSEKQGSTSNISGGTVGVFYNTLSREILSQYVQNTGLNITLRDVPSYPEGVEMLKSGKIDALAAEAAELYRFVNPEEGLVLLSESYGMAEYCVVSAKSKTALQKIASDVIAAMKKSGELQALYDKWGVK